jgi:hypothetical protein
VGEVIKINQSIIMPRCVYGEYLMYVATSPRHVLISIGRNLI